MRNRAGMSVSAFPVIQLGESRQEFLRKAPEAQLQGDSALIISGGVERTYTFKHDLLANVTTHPLERLDELEVRERLAEVKARLGEPDEYLDEVYSDRVRQDSDYRWRRDGILHVFTVAHFNDGDDYWIYESVQQIE